MIELKLELKQKAKNARGCLSGGGVCPGPASAQGGVCLRGCLSRAVVSPGGCLPRGELSVWGGGCLPMGCLPDAPCEQNDRQV